MNARPQRTQRSSLKSNLCGLRGLCVRRRLGSSVGLVLNHLRRSARISCGDMSLVVIHSERFAEHQTPPGHPERPERAEVMDVMATRWRERDTEVVAPPEATRDELARVRGAAKVATVDYDVNHGNGTQHIFESDPTVLYISTHQYPYYPGTGAADEIGRDAGRGFTVNLPLEAGAVDEDYRLVFHDVALPVLRQFAPDLLLVSARFDAHERDPLGGMRVATPAFAPMTMELRAVAEACCEGRIVAVTEGGYDLHALAASIDAVMETLSQPVSDARWPSSGIASARGRASVEEIGRAHV